MNHKHKTQFLSILVVFVVFVMSKNIILTSNENIIISDTIYIGLLIILLLIAKPIIEDINLSEFEDLIKRGLMFKSISKKSITKNKDILKDKKTLASIIKNSNYAVANLIIEGKHNYYYAYSSDKINESLKKDEIKIPDAIICNDINMVNRKLPMKRLSPKLEWVEFEQSGFAEKSLKCCERRIIAQILTDFNQDTLKGKELHIHTKYEPCLYCYYVLKKIQEDYGVDVTLYYAQMLPEIKLSKNIELESQELESLENFLNKFTYDEEERDIINNDINIKK